MDAKYDQLYLQTINTSDLMKEPERLTSGQFKKLSEIIQNTSGIFLKENKVTLLSNRLRKRLDYLGLDNFDQYCEIVFANNCRNEEISEVINAISTNETFFYRTDSLYRLMHVQ